MNFSDLIAAVSTDTGMAKEGVKTILEASIARLTEKAAAIDIPASRILSFTPAKALKEALKV